MFNLLFQPNSVMSTIWMFLLIFIVFYFFMIRPQIQKQKKEKIFQESLEKGNYIVTNSGIHGKIIDITENFFVLEVVSGKIKLEKNIISKDLTLLHYNNRKKNNKKDIFENKKLKK